MSAPLPHNFTYGRTEWGKEPVSETTPYLGEVKQAVPARTPYTAICRWGKGGVCQKPRPVWAKTMKEF